MDSKIGFEMSLIVVKAMRGRCASCMVLTASVSEIFGGQTNASILVVCITLYVRSRLATAHGERGLRIGGGGKLCSTLVKLIKAFGVRFGSVDNLRRYSVH